MKDSNNRLTVIIAIVVVFAAGFFFMKAFKKRPAKSGEVVEETAETVEPTQDQMGQPIAKSATPLPGQPVSAGVGPAPVQAAGAETEADRKTFAEIVGDLRDCLELSRAGGSDQAPVTIENLTNQMQSEFGPVSNQGDRWLSWKMRTPGGEERLLRVDYFEDEMGTPQRELHYFSMRSESDVFPIDVPADKGLNPPDSYIDEVLREGQVHYQEKAKYAIFPSGERVDFVEKNGALSEIEVTKGEHFFRCDNVKSRQSCHCVKEE